MRPSSRLARYLGSAGFLAIAVVGLAGCQTTGAPDITGSLGGKASAAAPETDTRHAAEAYGEKYRANPKDLDAGLRYGQALRANGQHEQAVAVLEQVNLAHPGNRAVLGAYGRALAENGSFKLAFDVLSRAHTPANPDWRILSIQGAVLDQMGKPDEARGYYASALKIRPDDPSVLSNLGLSYVLTKELPQAEATLRRAQKLAPNDPRIRQNLGLALGLQGRFAEAEAIVQADLPPDEAAANVAYLKNMLNSGQNGKTTVRPRNVASSRS
ncbi:tetratricopeptide repeat protein [[Pseudomonas] carboxydohydrogena]|uniref:Tetratricopeptide repeat protein n=1 Tax=Afipia carboxydohydrogena TaxID=290 RepID=A0ABY8BQ61_AFICR|nr:tetratricopeptide repeat protein [[Pseudomonas] carboxydohydrogena]WEF52120.1 tetratricopeptide repeat protein [[Pseudomonas] carboxydohydrogena]